MPFRFSQPIEPKKAEEIDPEKLDVEKASKPTRHTLQRAAQKWKQRAKSEHRNLLTAEPVKDE